MSSDPILFDQRLYVRYQPPSVEAYLSLRPALLDEFFEVEDMVGQMQLEDMGRDPRDHDLHAHQHSVRSRIEKDKILVADIDGEIGFLLDIGTRCKLGVQVGTVFVPTHLRGNAYGVLGMLGVCKYLLPEQRAVTLLARETNVPAIKTHERAGFIRKTPFRMAEIITDH